LREISDLNVFKRVIGGPAAAVLIAAAVYFPVACSSRETEVGDTAGNGGDKGDVPELTVNLGMNLANANKALLDCGAGDWTDACSYVRQLWIDKKKSQPSTKWRHYDLPNGMLVSLWCITPLNAIPGSEQWKILTGDDSQHIVMEMEISNSRLLTARKAETRYRAEAVSQRNKCETTLDMLPLTKGKDPAFIYKGQSQDQAAQALAKAKLPSMPLDDSELQTSLAVLNKVRKEPGFPLPDTLTGDGQWSKCKLSSDAQFFVQIKPPRENAKPVVTCLFWRWAYAASRRGGQVTELEVFDLLDPVLVLGHNRKRTR